MLYSRQTEMPLPDSISAAEELSPAQSELIRSHLRDVLASQAFEGSKRAQSFLALVVERALAGRHEDLRERVIGAEMFGRPIDYDTANDAVVRVKASEVRKKLAHYYRELRQPAPVRIELPSGSYVPKFHWKNTRLPDPPGREASTENEVEAPAASATQQFVTMTQEVPDAFTVVLEALDQLRQSTTPVAIQEPGPPPQPSPRRRSYLLPTALIALAASLLGLIVLLLHR